MLAYETVSLEPGVALADVAADVVRTLGVVVALVLTRLTLVDVVADVLSAVVVILETWVARAPEGVVVDDACAVRRALGTPCLARIEVWKLAQIGIKPSDCRVICLNVKAPIY